MSGLTSATLNNLIEIMKTAKNSGAIIIVYAHSIGPSDFDISKELFYNIINQTYNIGLNGASLDDIYIN